MAIQHGIRANLAQFTHQLFQVFLIGLTIGLERTAVPALAETEFGLEAGSFVLFMTFIVSFGFVKGAMNFAAGALSEKLGRRKVLFLGWLAALPIPFMILYGPSWGWIVAANVLLGLNQGFAWSMTVTAKIDITKRSERGLATGFNEFSGYLGVALGGLATGYLAAGFAPREALFAFGLAVILGGLLMALLFVRETLPFAHSEAAKAGAGGRYAKGLGPNPSNGAVFRFITYQNRTLAALCQAGCVEKFVDALVWAFFPVYLYGQGLGLADIGWVAGIYGMVWGAGQLFTGPLSDKVGRKGPIVAGMWLAGAGVASLLYGHGFLQWALSAAVTGLGMALLYPTLIAAVSDVAHPGWRGRGLGVYRFWRDLGYGIGALVIGLAADYFNAITAGFWLTAGAMGLSGLIVAIAARETLPRK